MLVELLAQITMPVSTCDRFKPEETSESTDTVTVSQPEAPLLPSDWSPDVQGYMQSIFIVILLSPREFERQFESEAGKYLLNYCRFLELYNQLNKEKQYC